MTAILEFLKGKKTYLQAAGVAIVVGLHTAGVIDNSVATMLLGLLGAGSIASIGAKIDRAAESE